MLFVVILTYSDSVSESIKEKRARLLENAKINVSEAYSKMDHPLIQAFATFTENERMINQMNEKLEEWYSMYFPELKTGSPKSYATFVSEFGNDKRAASAKDLERIFDEHAKHIAKVAEESMGGDPEEKEYALLKSIAEEELRLIELNDKILVYIKEGTERLMPNITGIIDYKVAAELLSKAGSVEKLALMPASTIQLLGAEKALFKHLKFGSKPPKYGALFKLQEIANANREDRGRIARVYATKLAIAARADAFSKNYIADRLNEDLKKALSRDRKHGNQNKK